MNENPNFSEWFLNLSEEEQKKLLENARAHLEPEDFISVAKQAYKVAVERHMEDVGLGIDQKSNYQRIEVGWGQVEKMVALFKTLGQSEEEIPFEKWSAIISNAGEIAVIVTGDGTETNPFVISHLYKKEATKALFIRLLTGLSWETHQRIFFLSGESEQLFIANEEGDVETF